MMEYDISVKIEKEDKTIFNDSVNRPYRMKLFASDKGPEELPQRGDKGQRIKNKAICKYCAYREICPEEENKI